MAMRKRFFLLLGLASLALVSCDEQPAVSGRIYSSEAVYDYSLIDDSLKGKAIYPGEALRQLRLIQSHNLENGLAWPESRFSTKDYRMTLEGDALTDFRNDAEYYIPGQYYLHETEVPVLAIVAEGYFRLDGEFFHGCRCLDEAGTRYYEPSTIEEMEEHWETKRVREDHYESFLYLVEEIERREFAAIAEPQDFQCYSREPGDLYINIYHCINAGFANERRVLARIVYEDYLPRFATIQTMDGILGDQDYSISSHIVSFEMGGVEIREDLDTFFGERRDA